MREREREYFYTNEIRQRQEDKMCSDTAQKDRSKQGQQSILANKYIIYFCNYQDVNLNFL